MDAGVFCGPAWRVQAKSLLGATLEEEKAADEKLNGIAKAKVNREAMTTSGDEEEEEEGSLASQGRRGANPPRRANSSSKSDVESQQKIGYVRGYCLRRRGW